MSTPGISLIIPTYNASQYLREAIESVLNQTLRPRQIIVVDDGSTDYTAEVIRSYGDAVTILRQPNHGTAAARNRGLAEADQPIIAFLDDDDRFLPDKLERQMRCLSDHPEAMLCVCKVQAFWSPEFPDNARREVDLTPQFRLGQPGSWLARRKVFDRAGTFNSESQCQYIEGSELFLRIENAGCGIARLDDALLERRLSWANKTNNSEAHVDGIMTLMKRRLQLRRAVR